VAPSSEACSQPQPSSTSRSAMDREISVPFVFEANLDASPRGMLDHLEQVRREERLA
jgi:hypothetical protein